MSNAAAKEVRYYPSNETALTRYWAVKDGDPYGVTPEGLEVSTILTSEDLEALVQQGQLLKVVHRDK